MAYIGAMNTKPELYVRKGLHRRGLRYRLHDRRLAGTPDIVLPKYRAAIFVNGCFWHGHDCPNFKLPSTRTEFWANKIAGNQRRDAQNLSALESIRYRCKTIWECETRYDRKVDGDLLDRIARWIKQT